MPRDAEPTARLFYDPSCGPCRFLAGAAQGLSRGRLESIPFNAPAAQTALADLPEEPRYSAAHVVSISGRSSGAAIVRSLIGTTFGPAAEGVIVRHPTLDRPLRWVYQRFWEQRRDRCAVDARA